MRSTVEVEAQRSHRARDQQDRTETRAQDREIQNEVAQVRRDAGQRVGAQQAGLRGQIVAVVAQEPDLVGLIGGIEPGVQQLLDGNQAGSVLLLLAGLRLLLLFVSAIFFVGTRDPRRQPAADVAAARDRGEVVEFLEQLELAERLQDTQIERRAPDTAAGQRQAHQLIGRDTGQAGVAG